MIGTNQNKHKSVTLNYKYYILVGAKSGSRICPYSYAAYNGAILVNKNGTPLNLTEGGFIGANGYYDTLALPTCVCDSYYSQISGCKVNETVYQNFTVFVVTDYKVIKDRSLFKCNSDLDCVPATCCHPTACINKAFAPNCTKAICTMYMAPGTLDYGSCKCIDNTCEAVIKNPVSLG